MRDNRHQGVEGVVEALKAQHQQIRTAMFAVMGAEGEARQRAFLAVRQLLALHEVVEEEVVHPVAGTSLVSGLAIVADRLKEEERVLVMISELEQFEVDAHEFTPRFRALQLAVTAHAEAEEEAELGALPHRVGPRGGRRAAVPVPDGPAGRPHRAHRLLRRDDGRGPRRARGAGAGPLTARPRARRGPAGDRPWRCSLVTLGYPAAVNSLCRALPCRP